MGEIVKFQARKTAPSEARGDFEELRFLQFVGEIRLSIACKPGQAETGPFFLLLQCPTEPPYAPVCLKTPDPDNGLLEMVLAYAHGMLATLWYADRNLSCLPSRQVLPPA